MKKAVAFCMLCALLTAACSSVDYTSNRKLKGIDYSAYENPSGFMGDNYYGELPAPSILDEYDFSQEEETLDESQDFTSEEIAASYGRYTDVTVIAAAKRVKLGASANSKNMALFQKALDAAYKQALRTYRPAGFTYSIASVGAVNPLSDIEVSCILGEQAANEVGQDTCNLFFNTLVNQYNTLLKEAQTNATL